MKTTKIILTGLLTIIAMNSAEASVSGVVYGGLNYGKTTGNLAGLTNEVSFDNKFGFGWAGGAGVKFASFPRLNIEIDLLYAARNWRYDTSNTGDFVSTKSNWLLLPLIWRYEFTEQVSFGSGFQGELILGKYKYGTSGNGSTFRGLKTNLSALLSLLGKFPMGSVDLLVDLRLNLQVQDLLRKTNEPGHMIETMLLAGVQF
jgi:hypothetical protein